MPDVTFVVLSTFDMGLVLIVEVVSDLDQLVDFLEVDNKANLAITVLDLDTLPTHDQLVGVAVKMAF